MSTSTTIRSFCGKEWAPREISLIREVVQRCGGLSRVELACTVCELVDWRRPNGELKGRECREFLECLEEEGVLELPAKRAGRPRGSRTSIPETAAGEPGRPLEGEVGEFGPVVLEPIREAEGQALFRELIGRYHYLGYRVPFGAQLRYLVYASKPERAVVGALQFSSPAWRMAPRDRWIGWSEEERRRNLQRVVSNSRFLLVPWVRVRNLASTVLSRAVRRVGADWLERYGVEPLLMETLVDEVLYRGGCYRAANWIEVGRTSGRGRMDRGHQRHGAAPKRIFVYPLVRGARRRLQEG